ncbi:procollagen C-endopeptidase enhancer 2b isoform X2 [Sebastes umbrosus]|uniref:procollagen C-endopeptidase enhancer 2b isoform X2 n=1 Tax=Sebastes umbrosus TaxID=72105 RepID=UPI00189F3DD2|nr:procollagen C-endopeptidase enhancer 2b isoform X2 [Sebastes umbrosus]
MKLKQEDFTPSQIFFFFFFFLGEKAAACAQSLLSTQNKRYIHLLQLAVAETPRRNSLATLHHRLSCWNTMPFMSRWENRRRACSFNPTMWTTCSLFCAWSLLFLTDVCAQSQQRPTFTCGGNITGESGVIGSQGYPGVYPPNTKCVWRITVPEGKVVVLSFRYIDLESDNLCRYDYVDVYSGHVSGQRLGRFCGTFKPGALVSTGNKMLLQMVSDANTAGSGFLTVFSAAHPHERGDQYCGGRLDKPSGSFKTPNWPEKDYPAGVTCSWHIVAPKNQIIEIKFEKFDVERDNYCRYDHVSIFNGAEINDAKRIGKYCGDSPPDPVFSDGNQLLIQFLSDLSLTADGFIGHYKFRPKKFLTTTMPPTTTTQPVTTRPIRSSEVLRRPVPAEMQKTRNT